MLKLSFEPEMPQLIEGVKTDALELGGKSFRTFLFGIPPEMRRLMNESPATGRHYRQRSIEGGQRFSVASSPGNAPRNQSFSANKSFRATQTSDFSGEIETNDYIDILDRKRNRPLINPAIDLSLERTMPKL